MGDSDPLIEFISVTDADPEVASLFLAANDGDLQEALHEFFAHPTKYTVDDSRAASASVDGVRAPIAPKKMVLQDFGDDDVPLPVQRIVRRPRVVFETGDLRAEAQALGLGLAGGSYPFFAIACLFFRSSRCLLDKIY